ncbi:hypothetical protein F-S17_0125 [Faustovirus]|nr:hypothetical protein F-LCD7_0140 [Faustovirus]QJX71903.1 hypothetical protein F-M6_0140 [Faustovirus]QJX72391.1 hypothetical protein F-S17_0125 [Faustovirus]QJX72901.1 hypothetical protein F-VV57_0139 [Faustovirus]QJX73406.1 hypothetical protein F-VV63_0140 [Faustovirus]
MKFCPNCENKMNKSTATGEIEFTCDCGMRLRGGDEDTLMDEEVLMKSEFEAMATFIENTAFDDAADRVKRDCPECGLDFMQMLRIGKLETTFYVCSCGYKVADT